MTDADKVLAGRDGYLFLTNDTNRVLDQVQGIYQLPERQLWSTAMIHAARAALCSSLGATYHHVLVPDRETALLHFLPETIIPGGAGLPPVQQYLRSGAAALLPPFYAPIGSRRHLPRRPTFTATRIGRSTAPGPTFMHWPNPMALIPRRLVRSNFGMCDMIIPVISAARLAHQRRKPCSSCR